MCLCSINTYLIKDLTCNGGNTAFTFNLSNSILYQICHLSQFMWLFDKHLHKTKSTLNSNSKPAKKLWEKIHSDSQDKVGDDGESKGFPKPSIKSLITMYDPREQNSMKMIPFPNIDQHQMLLKLFYAEDPSFSFAYIKWVFLCTFIKAGSRHFLQMVVTSVLFVADLPVPGDSGETPLTYSNNNEDI